ncbi:MAG: Phosphoribosylformylglycinamidine cyclo-ligase [Candidatus Taylorbacteria bacterium]|nr:Phosphoribosylformylglycinamidine cyclo-ligase [Candidatus Taylorbacteria bacterium]
MSDQKQKSLYSGDGVDIHDEADFSKYAGSICKQSYNNSNFVDVHDLSEGQFRGPRPFTFKNLPEGFLIEASTDGIGTKGIIIDAAKTHADAAYDIIAMTSSDITRYGGLPLVFINVLDTVSVGIVGSEARNAYKSLMDGLGKVAKDEGLVVLKGETAQMGVCLGSEIADSKTKLNWSGMMIGAYHKDKMITGNTIKEGQVIIALKENGFRSNGISSVRKALVMKYGQEWWKNIEAKDDIKKAAEKSVLYDKFINTLHGWYDKEFKAEIEIHSVVHLSGGAMREKLAHDILFTKGLGANITDLWEPAEIMANCAKWREMSDDEFYETWHGGQGMLLVINKEDVEHCLKRAEDFGIKAKLAGVITKTEKPTIKIISKLNGKEVIYQ